MRRSPLKPGKPLKRGTPLTAKKKPPRRRPISPASPEQQEKVRHAACVACGRDRTEVRIDPAHLIPRGLGGCDSPLCVVPACAEHHRLYDDGKLDLLPHLEGRYPAELGHAVEHVGLVRALERVTNERWQPTREGEAV